MLSNIAINLHPDECSQEFLFQSFAFKLDKCVESCNTFNDLCNTIDVPNKTKNLNISMLKMITGINKSKTFTKHISC